MSRRPAAEPGVESRASRALAGARAACTLSVGIWACGDSGPTGLQIPPDLELPPDPEVTPALCEVQHTVALGAGEAMLLQPGDSLCVDFAEDGRYTLAYFDTAGITASRNQTGPFNTSHHFTASAHLQHPDSTPPPSAASVSATVGTGLGFKPEPMDVRFQNTGSEACDGIAASVYCRDRPWAVGDTFTFHSDREPRSGTVVALKGPLALAHWTDQLKQMSEGRDLFSSLASEAAISVIPYLRRTTVDAMVTSSPASGQLLIIAYPGNRSVAWVRPSADASSGVIELGMDPESTADLAFLGAVQTVAHELAHLWQFRHLYELSGGENPSAPRWAIEGGANLFAKEYLRMRMGIPLEPNRVERTHVVIREPEDIYWNQLHVSRGDLEQGYAHAEPFLRHLLIRQVRSGVEPEVALRTVLLGAVESWNGQPNTAWAAEGLARRLERVIEGGWSPAEGVLTWALSNALDERTTVDRFQNYTFAEAWRVDGATGWPEDGSVRAFDPFFEVTRPAGATGYIHLSVPREDGWRVLLSGSHEPYTATGGSVFDGTPFSAVRWMVVREP